MQILQQIVTTLTAIVMALSAQVGNLIQTGQLAQVATSEVRIVSFQQGASGYSGAKSTTFTGRQQTPTRTTHYYRLSSFNRYYNLEHFNLGDTSSWGTVTKAELIFYRTGGFVFSPSKIYLRRINDPNSLGAGYATGWKVATSDSFRGGANVESRDDSVTPDIKWQSSDPSSPDDLNIDYFQNVLKPLTSSPSFTPASTDAVGKEYVLDVTSDVECFRSGVCKNQGWATYHESDTANIPDFIGNSNYGTVSLRPKLVVTYSTTPGATVPPPPTPPPAPEPPTPPILTAPSTPPPDPTAPTLTTVGDGHTWYIRTDGGNSSECNGKADAPYPGTGTNQNCAFKNPFYLWNNDTAHNLGYEQPAWKIKGGDTVIIKNGEYRMGYKTNDANGYWNYLGCRGNAQNCFNPPIPSGTASKPTKIVGENWQNGCQTKPVLRGAGASRAVLNLNDTSFVDVSCLEITDNAQCRISTFNGEPYACVFPWVTDHAYAGIQTNINTAHVNLKNLNIHGMASIGIIGSVGGYVTGDYIRLSGNGNGGWWTDPGGGAPSYGPFSITNSLIEWSACVEQYPIVSTVPIMGCYDQSGANANGDGIGFVDMTGDVTIDHNIVRYNQQDGLDALYIKSGNNLNVTNNNFYGNEGQQIKTGGAKNMNVRNNLVTANCNRMKEDFAGMPNPGLWNDYLASHCRAGDGIALIMKEDSTLNFENNSYASYTTTLMTVGCRASEDTWTSLGRKTDWTGALNKTEALNGSNRYITLANTPTFIGARSITVDGAVGIIGRVYKAGSGFGSSRFEISSVNTTANTISRAKDGLVSGSAIRFFSTANDLPAPLKQDTYYYIVSPTTSSFQVSASVGGAAIDLTSLGSGTIYYDKDYSPGVKYGWWYDPAPTPDSPTDWSGSPRILMDPSLPTPPKSSTVVVQYGDNVRCNTAKLNFNNNLVRGYNKIEQGAPTPTMFWNISVSGASGMTPAMRRNNFYCGLIGANLASVFNKPGPTETWSTTCPGTWFAYEPPPLTTQAGLDNINLRWGANSPALGAGIDLGFGVGPNVGANADLAISLPPSLTSSMTTMMTPNPQPVSTPPPISTQTSLVSTQTTSEQSEGSTEANASSVAQSAPSQPCTKATLTRTLYISLKGDDVKTLQTFLIGQNYLAADNATGYFGPFTEKAVQAFQRANNIVSSGAFYSTGYGSVGPMTRAKINPLLCSGGAKTGSQQTTVNPSIEQLQAQIKILQAQVNALLLKLQSMNR